MREQNLFKSISENKEQMLRYFLLYLALIGVSLPPVIILFMIIGRTVVLIGGRALPTAHGVIEIILAGPLLTITDPLVIMRNERF